MVFFWVCLLWGLWAIALDLFKMDPNGPWSCVAGAFLATGAAVWAFIVAWTEKDGWTGNVIPFVPAKWNQAAPRMLFAVGGLFALICSFKLMRKAFKKFKGAPDEDSNLSIE